MLPFLPPPWGPQEDGDDDTVFRSHYYRQVAPLVNDFILSILSLSPGLLGSSNDLHELVGLDPKIDHAV